MQSPKQPIRMRPGLAPPRFGPVKDADQTHCLATNACRTLVAEHVERGCETAGSLSALDRLRDFSMFAVVLHLWAEPKGTIRFAGAGMLMVQVGSIGDCRLERRAVPSKA
jgi:hypothetical protein